MKIIGYAVFKKKFLVNSFKLIGSGLLTSVFVILISSNRLFHFQENFAIKLLLLIQWETLGLTFSKLGFDSYYFSQLKAHPEKFIDFKSVFLKISIPGMIFCLGSLVIYDWKICLFLLTAIYLDVFSTIIISYFNALENFNVTVVANLFNYPIFFIVLIFLNLFFKCESLTVYFSIFVLSSFIRVAFLFFKYKSKIGKVNLINSNYLNSGSYKLGLQQIGNYYLFKSDQIILNFTAHISFFNFITDNVKLSILFYIKLSELLNGLVVTLSPLYLESIFKMKENIYRYIMRYALFSLVGLSLFFYCAGFLWRYNTQLYSFISIPYIFYCMLILPVNQLIYFMMRENLIDHLLKILLLSILIGFVPVLLMVLFKSFWPFLFVTGINLFSFILLFKLKINEAK